MELLSGWVKIHKIPHVIFETTSQFFFKLHITLHCQERWLFCTFLAETLYYFDKRSPSKYQILDFQIHQIYTVIGSFCWKYIKFQLKKYRGVVSHGSEDWCKIWRKVDLLLQNWKEFGVFWSEHLKVSKMYTLIFPFREKYVTFDLKKNRGVLFHDTWERSKIRRKTDLRFGKSHEEFSKFSPEHLKTGTQNLDFYGVLLSQVENVWAWNSQGR